MKRIRVINNDFVKYMKNRDDLYKDQLTGLPNKRALYENYQNVGRSRLISAFYVDADYFAGVNEAYGYSEGDALIKAIADYLSKKCPEYHIYKIEGDEFIVGLVGKTDENRLISIATEIINDFGNIDFNKNVLSMVKLSVGILANQRSNLRLDSLIDKIKKAMQDAKEQGKDSCVVFCEKRDDSHRFELESEMEAAFTHNEFVPHILPKYEADTGKMYGAELLCRWNHWLDGIRRPTDFLPVMEQTGLIKDLDLYMLEEACKMKKSWEDLPLSNLVLSINVSGETVCDKEIPEEILRIVDKYGVRHEEIDFEIKETSFFRREKAVAAGITKLIAKGFRITVDGFGSGCSLLTLFDAMNCTTLKIDKNIVKKACTNEKGLELIKCIAKLCERLNFGVLAEGVESDKEESMLKKCGIKRVQGFNYSRPMPIEDFIKYGLSICNTDI